MNKTCHTIKDNNKKASTGRGCISWEYYDIFDDRAINVGPVLSSLSKSRENELQEEINRKENSNFISSNNDSALGEQDENSIDNPCTSNNSQDSSEILLFKNRFIRRKDLYTLRKEQLELDAKRVQLLQELVQNINTANKIQ